MKPHIYEIKVKPKEMLAIVELIGMLIEDNREELAQSQHMADMNCPWRDKIKSELALLRKIRRQLEPQVKRALGEK